MPVVTTPNHPQIPESIDAGLAVTRETNVPDTTSADAIVPVGDGDLEVGVDMDLDALGLKHFEEMPVRVLIAMPEKVMICLPDGTEAFVELIDDPRDENSEAPMICLPARLRHTGDLMLDAVLVIREH